MKIKKFLKSLYLKLKTKNFIPIVEQRDENKEFEGRVALVIGGSGGIGISISKKLVNCGCKVIICASSIDSLERTRNSFEKKDNIEFFVFNLLDDSKYEKLIYNAGLIFGTIDILIMASGVHSKNPDFFSMTSNEYDRVMNINLKSVFFVCQKFSKYLINEKKKGNILLISSSRGNEPAFSPYGISKWGLNGFVKGLAQQLTPYRIVVNAIAPGTTATDLIGYQNGESIYSSENFTERLIMPEEVANLAKLLLSDSGRMIIGETILISGGRGVFDIR